MKTAATVFLLVLLVSVQTPIGQLFKLPQLIGHFIKHQKQNGVSLIDFLGDHYAKNHKDADLPEDNQLPFKNITFYNIGYAIVPAVIKANVFETLPNNMKVIFADTYLPQQHLTGIFHPPRA